MLNHFDHIKMNPYLREWYENYGEKYIECYKLIRNLSELNKTTIIYLFPTKSKQDKIQKQFIKDINNVLVIPVNTSRHGIAIYPFAIQDFIHIDIDQAKKLVKKRAHNKFFLSARLSGMDKAIVYMLRKIVKIKH